MSALSRARCSICTSQFQAGNIAAVSCGHTYHYECLQQWLVVKPSCPICRKAVSERTLIKQLFFDTTEADSDAQKGEEVDQAAKFEELSIEVQKLRNETCSSKEELIAMKKQRDSLSDKLEREKAKLAKKLPGLESRNRHLEMMLQDQEELRREVETTKARLRACEFYKLVLRGKDDAAEGAIDKYVNQRGDPDSAQFLTMMKRQLSDTKKQMCRMNEDLQRHEKRLREQEKKEMELKKLVQALKEEADELRLAANKTTPYNPKLKSVFDRSPTKRASLGFNQSLNLNEDLIESAFKRPVPKGGLLRVCSRVEPMARPDEDGSVDLGHMEVPSSSSARIPFPSLDDTMNDSFDLEIPKSVMNRVFAGSPKKKTNPAGAVPRDAVKALENIGNSDAVIGPRPIKKIKKNTENKPQPPKIARISSFFTRTKSSSSLASDDDIISLE